MEEEKGEKKERKTKKEKESQETIINKASLLVDNVVVSVVKLGVINGTKICKVNL